MTQTEKRERTAQPEHRWPAVIATVVALAAYAFLPSVVPAIERYAVVGVCLLMVVALVAYGILPVIDTTIAGLRSVRPSLLDAARGMGLAPRQVLFSVELPTAAPIILAGIRTSVAISIGTATIGSTVGALTLGSPIIEGLSGSNTAYVIEGAIVVGLLAVTVDQAFAWLDLWLRRHQR